MFYLEIDNEQTSHETLEDVAYQLFETVDFEYTDPFNSVRGKYKVNKNGEDLTIYEKLNIENLTIELIKELQEEVEHWNKHINLERLK